MSAPINPTQYDPNDPRVIRVTSDTVKDYFERVTTNAANQGKGLLEPGWRCRKCAWTVPGIGLPVPHLCQAVSPLPPRRVGILSLNLGLLVDMMRTQGPATFLVSGGLPEDAKALGANIDAATGTLQLMVGSDTFPEAGIDEHGQIQVPIILPVVYFTQCAVVPVVELEGKEAPNSDEPVGVWGGVLDPGEVHDDT